MRINVNIRVDWTSEDEVLQTSFYAGDRELKVKEEVVTDPSAFLWIFGTFSTTRSSPKVNNRIFPSRWRSVKESYPIEVNVQGDNVLNSSTRVILQKLLTGVFLLFWTSVSNLNSSVSGNPGVWLSDVPIDLNRVLKILLKSVFRHSDCLYILNRLASV